MTGPRSPHRATYFSEAFDQALLARGMTLRHLAELLSERGTPVSVAALSYWRTGRSQPERGVSRMALDHAEELLELEAGALSTKLTRPRRSRSRANAPIHPFQSLMDETAWPDPDPGQGEHVNARTLSIEDITHVDEHRRAVSRKVSFTVLAVMDDVDAVSFWSTYEVSAAASPTIASSTGCDIIAVDQVRPGLATVHVRFPHALSRAMPAMASFVLAPHERSTSRYDRWDTSLVRHLGMKVVFDEAAVPSRSWLVTGTGRDQRQVEATMRPDHTLQHVSLEHVGRCGFAWEW